MANSWLRLWHDMPNDPKWRTIARVSGQPIALVQAVYLQLLVSASQNPVTDDTGVTLHIVTVTNEDIASALDVTEGDIKSVTDAMQGRVLNGKIVSGWDRRQTTYYSGKNAGKPPMTGAERAKACRDRKKQKELEKRNVTMSNVTETSRNDVTPQIRKEEIRKDIKELKPKINMSDSGGDRNQAAPAGEKQPGDAIEIAFENIFWRAGLRKDARVKALAAFRSRYLAWKAAHHGTPTEFAEMLADDIRLRVQAKSFGFDKLLPTSYLNGERWNDERPVPEFVGFELSRNYNDIPPGFRG